MRLLVLVSMIALKSISGSSSLVANQNLLTQKIFDANKEKRYTITISLPNSYRPSSVNIAALQEMDGWGVNYFIEPNFYRLLGDKALLKDMIGQAEFFAAFNSLSCKYRNGFEFGTVTVHTRILAKDWVGIWIKSSSSLSARRLICMMLHNMRIVAMDAIHGSIENDYGDMYMTHHTGTEAFFSNDISQGKVTMYFRSFLFFFFKKPFIKIEYLNGDDTCLRIPIEHELVGVKKKSTMLHIIAKELANSETCPMTDSDIEKIVQEAASRSN